MTWDEPPRLWCRLRHDLRPNPRVRQQRHLVPSVTGRTVSKIDVHDNWRSMMPSSDAARSTLLSVTATLAIWLTVPAHGQVTVAPPELLSGPWEFATGPRVDGILVMINQGTADGLTRETVQVLVYHRQDGRGTRRWHVVSPPRYAAQFDGRQLIVAGLTATFDPDTLRWTGEWVLDGVRRQVVLQRPRPANDVSLKSLCGVWEGLPEAAPAPSIRIHIVQSSDGVLTAWMNSSVFITDRTKSQRFGQSMEVVSADPNRMVLQNEAPNYQTLGRFTGALSSDGNTMAGQWNGRSARRTVSPHSVGHGRSLRDSQTVYRCAGAVIAATGGAAHVS